MPPCISFVSILFVKIHVIGKTQWLTKISDGGHFEKSKIKNKKPLIFIFFKNPDEKHIFIFTWPLHKHNKELTAVSMIAERNFLVPTPISTQQQLFLRFFLGHIPHKRILPTFLWTCVKRVQRFLLLKKVQNPHAEYQYYQETVCKIKTRFHF